MTARTGRGTMHTTKHTETRRYSEALLSRNDFTSSLLALSLPDGKLYFPVQFPKKLLSGWRCVLINTHPDDYESLKSSCSPSSSSSAQVDDIPFFVHPFCVIQVLAFGLERFRYTCVTAIISDKDGDSSGRQTGKFCLFFMWGDAEWFGLQLKYLRCVRGGSF